MESRYFCHELSESFKLSESLNKRTNVFFAKTKPLAVADFQQPDAAGALPGILVEPGVA